MTYYVSSGTLNPTHSLTNTVCCVLSDYVCHVILCVAKSVRKRHNTHIVILSDDVHASTSITTVGLRKEQRITD